MVEKGVTFLTLKWKAIPWNQVHGFLKGYKIKYKKVVNGDYIYQDTNNWRETQATLSDLEKNTTYIIHIAGYTLSGIGPYSQGIMEMTEKGQFLKMYVFIENSAQSK